VSTLNKLSKSLMNITTTADSRSSQLELKARRDLHLRVTSSRLEIKDTINRKCVYLLCDLFDSRENLHCVRTSHESWTLWDFDRLKQPKFDDDELELGDSFPIFANVYQVSVFENSTQSFLKCDYLLYERCGYPCSHILRITNKMENTMVKIQHWKIYAAYYGKENSELSKKLIELVTLQCSNEGCGMPISHECVNTCLSLPSK
jgi:hypothetical protein